MAQTAVQDRTSNIADFALPPQIPAARGNVALVPEPPAPKMYSPKLARAIMAITREFGVIAKATNKDDPRGGWNSFHNYGYQKWEDVLERESVLLASHGIIIQQSETARTILDKLISITYEFTLVNEDGDAWPDRPVITAIARLIDNKGIFDDKAANKCHTQAHKYFLLHFFKIRTKEAVVEDSDADGDELPAKQTAAPKPPKPGSAEAKALEGPRAITGTGPEPADWAEAFAAAVERAESHDEIDRWIELNQKTLDRLAEVAERVHTLVQTTVAKRRAALAGNKPKPPRPAAAAPKANPMPDPTAQPAEFIEWLKTKFENFDSYDAGEKYWNETVEALDLPVEVQEDAMGVWQRFENIWAP